MTDPNPAAALTPDEAHALLCLQLEWGADEALDDVAHDRFAVAAPVTAAPPPLRPRQAAPWSAPVAAPMAFPLRGSVPQAEAQAAACDSIEALRAALLSFTGCPLRDTASHTLFAEGDPGSGVMLIGEVPDADEDRAGHPFAGPSGALFDRMLASIGLSRAGLLIAPLIPWRPPGDRKPGPIEIAACLPFLHRLVTLVRPRQLMLMGARPARALLAGETPLARLRGRWLAAAIPGLSEPVPTLAMRHPAALLATPSMRRDAWHDLLLLRTTLDAESSRMREATFEQRR